MEEVLLQLPRGKAAGLDGLTAELMQLHVPSMARQLLPVFLKSALAVREPTAFRGGPLMVLAKKAFAALECSRQFRAILLSSAAGKTYHRLLRRHLSPHLASFKHELQAGSLPGVGTDTLLLLARAAQGIGKAQRRRTALLFFDMPPTTTVGHGHS